MTSWSIRPADVQAVLNEVQATATELGEQLPEAKFQSVLDGLGWAGPLTGDVPAAVNAMLGDQMGQLTTISNRINAGTLGVANAVIAYNNGQEDMAGAYQAELTRAAETGDFTYFAQHGHQG
ncbi:DUF6507 family protein [Cellulomonas cellasea]|uniref:DUF6507 family protein n=1 Tax=Cellulomonas cellasea TaxID=43670 RepID=UPI0025A36AC2|nr:DUF6507 family protein [Cellulomonas cellasea]MDM8084220.1 DUF6507 family protein [Cellulomonas cellasea]